MHSRRSLQERLASQRAVVGLLQSQANPALAEMAGMCGYDFLFLDGEHGVFSEADFLHTMRALAGVGAMSLIRVPKHDTHAIGRYMDMGADIILVPNVSTVEQAKMLARGMVYPPAGTRGMGAPLHRGTRYGLDAAKHLAAPREGVSLMVIIESKEGAKNAPDILAVDGIDGVVIGPADLSADMGVGGNFTQPGYPEAIARIEKAALDNGKILGVPPHGALTLEVALSRGYKFFIIGSDTGLLRDGMMAQIAKAKSVLEAKP